MYYNFNTKRKFVIIGMHVSMNIEGKIKQLKVFQISIIVASSYVKKKTGIWSTHKQNYDSVLNPFKIATQKIKIAAIMATVFEHINLKIKDTKEWKERAF